MLLLKFEFEDIKDCRTFEDVLDLFGISTDPNDDIYIGNRDIFGKTPYHGNMYIDKETYDAIYEALSDGYKLRGRSDAEIPALSTWIDCAPLYSGPKFMKLREAMGGELNRSVLYIATPGDDIYTNLGE